MCQLMILCLKPRGGGDLSLLHQSVSIQMCLLKHPDVPSAFSPLLIGLVTSYFLYNQWILIIFLQQIDSNNSKATSLLGHWQGTDDVLHDVASCFHSATLVVQETEELSKQIGFLVTEVQQHIRIYVLKTEVLALAAQDPRWHLLL